MDYTLNPKCLQDWAQNDTAVVPLGGLSKIHPSSARPAAGRDVGCRMRPTLGPIRGLFPFLLPKHLQEGNSELQMGMNMGRARGVLQSSVAKTFIELFFKCTVGCVDRAAYRMLLWMNTQYLNTLFSSLFTALVL